MAYIRNKTEERTGYQIGGMPPESVDNQCDFVMVYRLDESYLERIKRFRELGYVIHFMTGISWGAYKDYLYGEYDGINHWDEAQTDRYGNLILHGVDVPYMVPTVAFADYITEKLKKVVDAGVEAIHVEEPEFWDRAGYSPAFQREYALYYREPWTPPHKSTDARYKCAKLKAYLFTRTIDRLSSSLKEYAKVKYNKDLRFYVPTHSLLNYTQWKIVSPEGKLADIPAVDGCIAQVWTGTSREKNWFNGEYKERTFETAYLEYGVMQELVKGTGRQMWFLHDPIEDNPIFDWNDYRRNYLCTVAASLMHPKVNTYEICPWPNRVFEDKYPKNSPDAEPIPAEYATLLNNMFNTLGTFEGGKNPELRVGILMADTQLCQREYPDSEFSESKEEEVGTVLRDSDELVGKIKTKLFANGEKERELMLKFMSGNGFPAFYSLALPLLKYGIPVRPVLLDNARRYNGYLDDYDVLIMSYEYMKPDYPDANNSIAGWVRRGGTLIYAGNGFDPYHNIRSWWSGSYENAAEHLFEALEIDAGEKGIYSCGKGIAAIWKENPAVFSFSKQNADSFREFFTEAVGKAGFKPEFRNYLLVEREPYYTVAAVLDESISDEPLVLEGKFADMFTPDFAITDKKIINPGENCLLFDLDKAKNEKLCIIGTSARIFEMKECENKVILSAYGASGMKANIRLKLPFEPSKATADGKECEMSFDKFSSTALISYESSAKQIEITVW